MQSIREFLSESQPLTLRTPNPKMQLHESSLNKPRIAQRWIMDECRICGRKGNEKAHHEPSTNKRSTKHVKHYDMQQMKGVDRNFAP